MRSLDPLIFGKDLNPSHMRVLAILMIFADPNLQHSSAHTGPSSAPLPLQVDLLPPPGLLASPCAKLNESVIRAVHAAEKLDFRGRVGFIEGPVEVDAQLEDGDGAGEVGGEEMWLRSVGLPESEWGWIEQGAGAAVGFVRTDCPGGESGDLTEAEMGFVSWKWKFGRSAMELLCARAVVFPMAETGVCSHFEKTSRLMEIFVTISEEHPI